MSGELSNRSAIITGASTGIGKAFSEALLKKGAKVCIADIEVNIGEKTVKEFQTKYGKDKVIFVNCDVRNMKDMKRAFEKTKNAFGTINIVCNNAGVAGEKLHNWENTVDVNLKGVICGTFLGIEYLRKDTGGSGGVIINTSSVAGLHPFSIGPVYTATKHGIVGLTRSWAANSKVPQYGIRFCVVCPSSVDTQLIVMTEDNVLDVNQANAIKASTGLMEPEYVAEAFMQLVEDETKNGAVLKVTKAGGFEYMFESSL